MVSGSTTEIQNAADVPVAVSTKQPLDQVALGFIVFLLVERVVTISVNGSERLTHESTS